MDSFTPPDALPRRKRAYDAERTRRAILDAASTIFAEKGLSGANVNEIVARAGSTKPMVYYHFGSKEGLFAAVLEEVYAAMRGIESALDLGAAQPEAGLRRLVEATFDYHAAHPDWMRLIAIANIHDAQHIAASPTIAAHNMPVIAILADLLERGRASGAFCRTVDPLHLHLLIASMSFHRVSNRHSWRVIFERDLMADVDVQRTMLADAVLAYVRSGGADAGPDA